MLSISSNQVPFNASLIDSFKRCARHHIQKIHGIFSSTKPLRPAEAILAAAPSVAIPTNFLQVGASLADIQRD